MSNPNGKKGSAVPCGQCGKERVLLYPKLAGSMCRACAARIGSRAASAANTKPLIERFNAMTQSMPNGCVEWIGHRQPNGYGSFALPGQTVRAHRWSYEYHMGPIPDGLQIDHLCRNRACVKPSHLEPVTARENSRRAMRSACINGHEFSDENTYMHGGKRYCRTCRRNRTRVVRAA